MLAAVYLARFCRRVALFDASQSRARWIPRTRNVPAYPDGLSGETLLERLDAQLRRYRVRRIEGEVRSLQGSIGAFRVGARYAARRVLLATGVEDNMPEDLEYLWPLVKRAQVRLCPVCDAYELRGKRIGILSRGEAALKESRFLLNYSRAVWVITHGTGHCDERIKTALAQDSVKLAEGLLQQVVSAKPGLRLLFRDGQALGLDALYVGFGVEVKSGLARSLGARCDAAGYLEVDQKQQTSVPGVYAAGDVVQSLSQISVAFGQAAIAASAINVALNAERWPA